MAFEIRAREATAGGTTSTVYELFNTEGTARAEVWPAFGFNCLRWQVPRADGTLGDLLYCDPTWEQNPVATRSGHPILFPFPNRTKHGRFRFEGREYQLPLNESSGQHAIHGFSPKTPWRVVGRSSDEHSAKLAGEFRLSVDRPDLLACWPGDCAIRLEYSLKVDELAVDVTIGNPAATAYPFGLGFHPYFACPNAPDAKADEMILTCPTTEVWESEGPFPTGKKHLPEAALDFRNPKAVATLQLDTLFGVPSANCNSFASLGHSEAMGVLSIEAGEAFREVLLFTPPHRRAVAIEPYTCTTDAANLAEVGIDSGWRVLAPGDEFAERVRYRWDANSRGSGD
jgi:aldose 1-epimerase